MFCRLITILFLTAFGNGAFAVTLTRDSIPAVDSVSVEMTKVDSILHEAQKQLGTPYGYGSTSTKRFDCSGLTSHCYAQVGIALPHSSAAQAQLGEKVKLKEVIPGDLLFFKGRSTKSKKVGHVAIVVSNTDGEVRMIHATSRGVIIDVYNTSDYYTRRFIEARRIIAE
jgi:cell wall-associated NlpC family hydrolase